MQPGGEAAPAREGVDPGGDEQQRVLRGLLGVLGIEQHPAADPADAGLDLHEQRLERLVGRRRRPGRQRLESLGLVRVVHPVRPPSAVAGPAQYPACPSPSRLGRLRQVERLGVGGFASVWLYHDDELESDVAVKALADNWAQRLDIRDRFLQEARILRRADSDHVVRVYDVGEVDGTPYFVMTYADLGTVADLLQREHAAARWTARWTW